MTANGATADVVLERRALYILPTREGLYYGGMLVVMLLAAVNYANGLAYALTFMLAAVGMVATLHTHRNLSGLRLSAGPAPPVFAGEPAIFTVLLHNDRDFARHAVEVSAGAQTQRVDVAGQTATAVEIVVPTVRRGYLEAPLIKLRTRFPVGLWRAWSRTVIPPVKCLVYPRPAPEQALPLGPDLVDGQQTVRLTEGEDFAGLRDYRHGDPMQRIAWKKVAAGQGWHTKQFTASAGHLIWLEWDMLPGLDPEERLGRMCRWVLMAEQRAITYGLRLPGVSIAPAQGARHRDHCLERLALFEAPAA